MVSQNGDGTGGECVFKPGRGGLPNGCLPDESFLLRHMGPGVLSLAAHHGPDSGGSCFNITFAACPLLDERAVVFGFVVQGHEVLSALQLAGDRHGWPTRRVTIAACGQVAGDGTAQPATQRRAQRAANDNRKPSRALTVADSDSRTGYSGAAVEDGSNAGVGPSTAIDTLAAHPVPILAAGDISGARASLTEGDPLGTQAPFTPNEQARPALQGPADRDELAGSGQELVEAQMRSGQLPGTCVGACADTTGREVALRGERTVAAPPDEA